MAERRPATNNDTHTLRPHQQQVLNLLAANELTNAELQAITSTKFPNRRIYELEEKGFEIIRSQIFVDGEPVMTYRYNGNVLIPDAQELEPSLV